MPKFSSLFKHKKIFAFFVLFFVISGIILPQIVFADSPACSTIGAIGGGLAGATIGGWICDWVGDKVAGAISDFGKEIIIGLDNFFVDASSGLADWIGELFANSIGISIAGPGTGSGILNWNITSYDPFVVGWTETRDLVNMLIVLGFVVVGISFALKIGEYGSKKMLFNLIIIALLINFSGLFCGLIIDGSNIAMKNFIGGTVGADPNMAGKNILPAIGDFAERNLTKVTPSDEWKIIGKATIGIAMVTTMYVVVILVFGYMLIVMFERYIMLGILFVLSPLAFFAWVFPATKKYWSKWWEDFIKYAFIGVGAGYFLWIAQKIISSPAALKNPPDNKVASPFYLLIVLVFLFISYKLIKKSSAIANAVVGLAKQAAGIAMGATMAVGGFATKKFADNTGLTRVGQNIKDRATSVGEKMGLVNKGTTANNKVARLNEAKKRIGNSSDEELTKMAEGPAVTHIQAQNKAAAAELLAGKGKFDKIDPNKRDAVAAHAAAFGVNKDVFTKGRPETFVSPTDKEAIEHATNETAIGHAKATGVSVNQALTDLKKSGYKPSDIQIRNAKLAIEKRRITENALGLSPVTDKDVSNKLIEDQQKMLISTGHTRQEALAKTKNYIPNAGQIVEAKSNFAQERIGKAIGKLSPIKAAELPREAVNEETIPYFTARQIREVGDKGGKNLIDEFAKYKGKTYKDPSTGKKTFAGAQSAEFAKIQAIYTALPPGREKEQLRQAIVELSFNKNI